MTGQRTDLLVASHSGHLQYGAERSLLELSLHLTSCGFRVHMVVSHVGSMTTRLESHGIPFSLVRMPYWVRWPDDPEPFRFRRTNPLRNTVVDLVKLIRELNPRLCLTNTITIPWLAYAAAITSTRHVWFVRESGTSDFKLDHAVGIINLRRSIASLSDGVFFNSLNTADNYSDYIDQSKNLGVIYPGGDPAIPEPINSPFRPNSFRLVLVGRIEPSKGQLDAVRAVALARTCGADVELAIVGGVGDQAYSREVLAGINSTGLQESVHIVGFQSNPSSYVALSHACLTCSRDEAFGRTTVEYMTMGKPVIGTRSGGTAEIIDHDTTGLLYEPGDVTGLAHHILRLSLDSGLRERLGEAAKSIAAKRFSAPTRYEPFLDGYCAR